MRAMGMLHLVRHGQARFASDDYDRLSGATARNGGFTGVRIQKA